MRAENLAGKIQQPYLGPKVPVIQDEVSNSSRDVGK